MDVTTFAVLVAAIYPPLKDAASYVTKRRGSISNNEAFREQLNEMIKVTQSDISELKNEIDSIRKITARIGISSSDPESVPWRIPHDVNFFLAWQYKRATKRIAFMAEEFSSSMVSVVDAIACCAGIAAVGKIDKPIDQSEPTWLRDLELKYRDAIEMVANPSKYSLDEFTNELEGFLDVAKSSLQKMTAAL